MLAENTVGRRIVDITEDLCDKWVYQLYTSKFAIHVDEDTDMAKVVHLIAHVRYVETYIGQFCCCQRFKME